MPMKREIADTEQMIADLSKQKTNQLTKPTRDAPDTAERRKQSLTVDIDGMKAALNGYVCRGQLPLTDTERVRQQIMNYLDACQVTGHLPTFMDVCCVLGRSRVAIYSWMKNNPRSPTTEMLKLIQTQIAAVLSSQALQRNVSEVVSIFLLKNSGESVQLNDDYRIVAAHEEPQHISSDEIALKYADILDE